MKLFEKNELKLAWPFYLEYFIASILFFMPAFIVVYFTSIGLSAFQMGILLAVWPLASLLFEIPTGAFADLYGRKASVLLGYFLEALVMLSLFFWKDFNHMIISFIMLGIAATFSSGSKDAWAVDRVNKKGKNLVHQFFTKMQLFINLGLIISGIIGAFLVGYLGLRIIFIACFSSYVASITLLYFFAKEEYIPKKASVKESILKIKNQTKQALKFSYKHHVLFYIIFASMMAALALNLQSNISWIPLLKDLGMKDSNFGYLWSAMALVMAISPLFAHKILKKGKERNFIVLGLVLWAGITLFVLFANQLSLALIILIMGMFFYAIKSPSEEEYFHRFIPSNMRATIGSVKNMFLSIAVIIILPLAGYLVDTIGARYTIFISAVLMIPAILLYLKIKEDKV